jgi:hypothetical protein
LLRGSGPGEEDFKLLGPDDAFEVSFTELVLPEDVL